MTYIQIPAAMFIEIAATSLPKESVADTASKSKELHVAVGDKSPDFIAGYLLGVKTLEVLQEFTCEDCKEYARHAYSDATTPGVFFSKCSKHRAGRSPV